MSEAYARAGVDLRSGERAIELIKPLARATHGPQVLGGVGPFAGLFAISGYHDPVLVASTDGVGTKLKIAIALDRHDTVGRDLVALSVNDVLTAGARPLFFLDYIAMGRRVPEKVEALVRGMAEECRANGCALLGGETAEMPDMYPPDEYDLAGFVVGAVERDRVIDGSGVQEGDWLWGLASSGLHTNGYTLVRRVLEGLPLDQPVDELERPLGEVLLEPHRSYLGVMAPLLEAGVVRAMAHITGGGLIGNIPRSLPGGLAAELCWGTWEVPAIFRIVQQRGAIPLEEMVAVFNMGLGFVFVTPAECAELVTRLAPEARPVGRIVRRGAGPAVRFVGGP